jgi:3'-phosphoadenosine 5'-phosphosulfate sulfotransferase (PAPS reductase)/FAD synthetase
MGTRKSDIKTAEEAERISNTLLHESTKPFPHFMRYYPVFLLSYSDIWMLILSADFPYLNLYDKGYSSIGHKDNTKVNINLYNKIDNTYYPAWYLQNEESERKFR